ncbi:MAG: class A beta-lactamase-related serine hydrolase [Patescibacteria group bacterium]|nr:class A beta-lactamase-related serine hydrolase [Patescibacteria group bacterium]
MKQPSRSIPILILSNLVLLGALIFVCVFCINHPHSSKYPLVDITRDFIPQEDFIINIQPLREQVREMIDQYGANRVSAYIEFLNTGSNIAVNPDLKLWSASLGKVPLGMTVMKKVENGLWDLNSELVLFEGDRDPLSSDATDPLFRYPIGTRFTIEKLMEYLLTYSDNTAGQILTRNLSQDDTQLIIEDTGAEELFTEEGKMSSKEYARLYRALYTSSFLNRDGSQKILDWLANASFRKYLSTGIPEGISFAHKYGENRTDLVIADSGIVYLPNRPFLMVVMVQKLDDSAAEDIKARAFMHDIAETTYNYFANYQ